MILVPELHPINAPLWWLVSRAADVRALYVHRACQGLLDRRLAALDTRTGLTSAAGWAVRERAVARWSDVVPRLAAAPWQVASAGRQLDFSEKAKQDLVRHWEDQWLLREMQGRWRSCAVMASACSAWLEAQGLLPGPAACPAGDRWLSRLNAACDRAWSGCVNLLRVLRHLSWVAIGLLRPSRSRLAPARYLVWCDSVDDRQLTLDKRSCLWLMDGHTIRPEDMLVIAPPCRHPAAQATPALPTAGRFVSLPAAYRRLPRAALWRAGWAALRLLGRCCLIPMPGVVRLLRLRYETSVSQWRPILDAARPRAWLETDSSVGIEEPALVYAEAAGITTMMYQTSAMLPYARVEERDGRDGVHAHILASVAICWSQAAARFLASHPQHPRTRFEILGPLLPGSDAVRQLGQAGLRRRYLDAKLQARAGLKYVAAFDVSPLLPCICRSRYDHPYPEPFTEEVTIAFLRDIVRLLSEFPQVALVYKSKRRDSLAARFPGRLAEYLGLLERLRAHERGMVLEVDANPWIPLAMADLCVAMAGSSPPWAALHYGIPALFHDPTDILATRDRQTERMSRYVTTDYASLAAAAVRLLSPAHPGVLREHLQSPDLAEYVGMEPGANGNAAFRRWLSRNGWQAGAPAAESSTRGTSIVAPVAVSAG